MPVRDIRRKRHSAKASGIRTALTALSSNAANARLERAFGKEQTMPTRYWALVSGILFVLVGLMGFVSKLTPLPYGPPPIAYDAGYGFLFGLFPINVAHNLVHLLVGLLGV